MKPIGLFAILLSVVVSPARQLVFNGDFELPARANGWTWDTSGLFNDTANCHLWESYYYDPDLDREVCVHKILHQWARLSQVVSVPSLNLNFSASAKLFCKTERPDTGYYATANIALEYLDENDSVLGLTYVHTHTGGCTWTNSPTVHLISVTDTTRWRNYSFNVNTELDNLPGVNRSQVRKIRIGLLSYVRNNC